MRQMLYNCVNVTSTFLFLLCSCFVCILYRIVYYRSKAVLFCENSNLRENKPCMVQTITMSAGDVFILWLSG